MLMCHCCTDGNTTAHKCGFVLVIYMTAVNAMAVRRRGQRYTACLWQYSEHRTCHSSKYTAYTPRKTDAVM